MPKPPYKFAERKLSEGPNNTGGLGTMTHINVAGGDPQKQVHRWRDDVKGGIWLAPAGHKYGFLTPFAHQLSSGWQPTLPDGTEARTLYLMDPEAELYEPFGSIPSPAQAHVTNKRGQILITTCPLLLRIVYPGQDEREWDIWAFDNKWYPTNHTMTLLDHDIDDDVYLWKDDVNGGTWVTKSGKKYGRLTEHSGTRTNYYEPAKKLWLLDPKTERLRDVGAGFSAIARFDGRELGSVRNRIVRMVNRASMDAEERSATSTVVESLFETCEGDEEDGRLRVTLPLTRTLTRSSVFVLYGMESAWLCER
ncbi:hypothetical protein BR93DRAFT_935126 [Coniochaeta sp. PMI_546]|nr:hypothetical protein BR93DRAFT_935126 [Coniochaeta sp. PMI_546]